MQPAQRNGILLIALLIGALWASRVPWNLGLTRNADVRLPELPERVGAWTSEAFDFKNDPAFGNYAGSRLGGRRYTHPDGRTVDLFLVGTGRFDQFHTPQFCYASDGFQIAAERTETLQVGDREIRAKRLRVTKPDEQQDVLFWFQTGEATADHRARIKLAAFTRMLEGRPPAPLILYRFSSVTKGEVSPLDAFIADLLPHLERGEVARHERAGGFTAAAAPF